MAAMNLSGADFVNLQITTSKNAFCNEKRFPKDIVIADLKNKLELLTGGSHETMQIELYSKDNKLICPINNDEVMLGYYPVENNMRLHVIDKFLLSTENMPDVPKYEMPKEEYEKRDDTVRQFMLKNKMAHFNEENQRKKKVDEEKEKELIEALVIGSRCKVTVKEAPTRLGTIRYKGLIEGLNGHWVGVQYDEPLGKNDGTCKGNRYFECAPKYGAFVKPVDVLMGDFPVEDYDLNEEI